jgi:hypothetical protein
MHFLFFGLVISFLPTVIAAIRHTHNTLTIFLINFFLGWTVIGWFVALILACTSWSYKPCYEYPSRYRGV